MGLLERRIQRLEDSQEAYLAWEAKWEAIEARLGGFPTKRHYTSIASAQDLSTVVWERDWEGFAQMEAAYRKLGADAEQQKLSAAPSVVASEWIEYYWTIP